MKKGINGIIINDIIAFSPLHHNKNSVYFMKSSQNSKKGNKMPSKILVTCYIEVTDMANAALISNEKSISTIVNKAIKEYIGETKLYEEGQEVEAIEELKTKRLFSSNKLEKALRLIDL